MANFSRVDREALYDTAMPLLANENALLLQGTRTQPAVTSMDQPTWQQEESFHRFKKQGKNRKWKPFDRVNGTTIVDNSSGRAIVPFQDAPPAWESGRQAPAPAPGFHLRELAPSSVHSPEPGPSAPSLPTKPSHTRCNQFSKHTPRNQPRPQKMVQVPPSAYVPPHLRKKACTNTENQAPTPEKTENSVSTGKTPAQPEQAQPEHKPVNGRPTAPLSPPSSPLQGAGSQESQDAQPNPAEADEQTASWTQWDTPKPEPPPQPKKRHNPRWPAPAPRHVWPKTRDMKPRSTDGGGESDGGIGFKSDSNGDPDYDVKKLMDWNGDWLPPPESWSARNPFADRHFGAGIEKWMIGHDESCLMDLTNELGSSDYRGVKVEGEFVIVDHEVVAEKSINKELAPRTWIPIQIEGDAPQQFWRSLPGRAPKAVSDIDITENQPFWEAYPENGSSPFLNPPTTPPLAILDPTDEEYYKPGVTKSANDIVRETAQKKQARNRRTQAKQNRPIQTNPLPQQPPARNVGYRPTDNVYFRPVVPADAKGIQELYNWYVANTVRTPEFKDRSIDHIVGRISAVTDEGLPYIVAVAKANRRNGTPHDYVNERIVGIASIEDYCDKGSMYRFTFELELFVHPGFVRKGIAKCLLDRLLEMVNTSYQAKGGYEWVNHGEYLKHGAGRVVKVLNITMAHAQDEDIEWVTKLMREFKFRKAGHLMKMGYKNGKIIDVTIYQHETTEIIDAGVPPREPL